MEDESRPGLTFGVDLDEWTDLRGALAPVAPPQNRPCLSL